MAESHFADVKFFDEDVALNKIISATISCTGKGSVKNAKVTRVLPEDNSDGSIKPQQQRKEENEQTISVSFVKQANVEANPAVPVFRYISKPRRKDGESPFSKCSNPKSTTKVECKFD